MPCKLVERVHWVSIKDEVASINPELAEAADLVFKELKNDHPIFRVMYPYGQPIVDKGSFQAPCGSTACDECRDLLHETVFSRIPLSLVLKNAAEVHFNRDSEDFNTIPLKILSRGELFGVFEVLDKIIGTADTRPPWSVSSGAKSIVIVAPIGDRRLTRSFPFPVEWTKNEPHWKLVQELASIKHSWNTEVIVFSSSLIEKIAERKKSTERFFTLLLRVGWQQSSTLRHASSNEAVLRRVYLEGPARTVAGQLPELQQFATVQHLFEIAEGSFPAFVPCHDEDCSLGPFRGVSKLLKDALKKVTGKDYAPVILYPHHLSSSGDSGYYSFRCPTLISASNEMAVRNFSELPFDIKRCVDMVAKQLPNKGSIDTEKTRYFAQSGRFDMSASSDFFTDLTGADTKRQVFLDIQFFVAGVRIVRG
jgi:hypothetical protein